MRKLVTLTCPVCRETFTIPSRAGPKRVYCGSRCYKVHRKSLAQPTVL